MVQMGATLKVYSDDDIATYLLLMEAKIAQILIVLRGAPKLELTEGNALREAPITCRGASPRRGELQIGMGRRKRAAVSHKLWWARENALQ